MQDKKRKTYKIVVPRFQTFSFDVEAETPENALSRLQSRLKADTSFDNPQDAQSLTSAWSDPTQKGEGWGIEGGDVPEDPTGESASFWDGQKITRVKLAKGTSE